MKTFTILLALLTLSACAPQTELQREDVRHRNAIIEQQRNACRYPMIWDARAERCRRHSSIWVQ